MPYTSNTYFIEFVYENLKLQGLDQDRVGMCCQLMNIRFEAYNNSALAESVLSTPALVQSFFTMVDEKF